MKKQSTGLGRGLGALIGDEALHGAEQGDLTLRVAEIEPNIDQPRKHFDEKALAELAESLKTHGVLSPITVRRLPSGYYQIIDGERRWRAARLANLTQVPVRIFEADDRLAAEMALIHNLQREDLAPLEEAQGFRQLINDYGLTQEETALRVGKSRPTIANALRLLSLPESVQILLHNENLTAGHARALLSLSTVALQEKAAESILSGKLSVRQAEALVKKMTDGKDITSRAKTPDANITALQQQLSSSLGRKVKITHSARKGKVELEYYGLDDLDALLMQLSKRKDA
ncbi:MAG: ParB/RepB/Spo0J family partition protein [Oscillospiraceae bacterium]|nr:ParB/RepB/Spo0J family partition protein [Oscillospiraceae bacterium]